MTAAESGLTLDVDLAPSSADIGAVDGALDAFNISRMALGGEPPHIAVFLRDARGDILGGCVGRKIGTDFHVGVVHVAEQLRGQGHGAALLARIEQQARRLGCTRITLDTFDFQAPEFYRKQGYGEIGRIDDMLIGHGRTWFRKSLTEAA